MRNPQGTPVWFELSTTDAEAAGAFYAAVAGWGVHASPMAEHGGYRLAGPSEHEGVAGIMAPPPGSPGFGGWVIYFAADDVDALAAQAAALGGTVAFGPMDIPHVGRFAMITDPQGVTFSIMRMTHDEPSTAFRQPDEEGTLGHGVWVEIATPDPDGALAFYGALFGWEKLGAMPMGPMGDYAFIGKGADVRLGAMMSSSLTGAPARWTWYIHVADIDAAIATATDRGGTLIQGPDEIPGGDFSANLHDPQGHQIGLVGARATGRTQ